MPNTIYSNTEITNLDTRARCLSKEINSKSGELCETLIMIRDQFLYQQMGHATFGDYVSSLPVSDRYVYMVLDTVNNLMDFDLTKTEATAVINEYGYQRAAAAADIAESPDEIKSLLNKTHKTIDLSDRKQVTKKRAQRRGRVVVYFSSDSQAVFVTEGMYALETKLGISQATLLEYMVVSALQDPSFVSVERVTKIDNIESIAEQIEKEALDKVANVM